MTTDIKTRPVSNKVVRELTYEILTKREDGQDGLAQLAITLKQIMVKGFVGQIVINCNGSGSAASVQVKETRTV